MTWLPKRFPADLPTEAQQWRNEYCGEWVDRPHWNQMRQLAEHYVDETEAYDSLVCTGRSERGVAIPVSYDERRSCRIYADTLKQELGWLALQLGFTAADWQHEVQRASERYDRAVRERSRR